MKNLKKIAALVIVLAMALSTVSFAAFTDVAEDASYNEAVTVMSALGLLKGYEDGSFGPDKTITRAEFAAVVVRMLGMEDAAAGAATATNFTDVPASHWAAGYVKIANQKEIISGYGDGTFGPDAEVTYEQAIKMLVCALGYAPMFADVKDAYPTAYMAQANTLGMTVGANGKIGDKATRAIVARLAYNALDDKLMEQKTFGTDKEFGPVDKTLLSDVLKVAKADVKVAPVGFTAEEACKIKILEPAKLGNEYDMFDSVTIEGEGDDDDTTYKYGIDAGEYDAVEGLSIPKGYAVTAFIDYNDDDLVVLAVVPKAGKNETLTLTATQMKEAAIDFEENTLEYYKTSASESSKTEKVKIAGDVVVYVNQNTYTTDAEEALANYAAGGIPTLTLINNDSDAAYDVIVVTDYVAGVVEEIYDADFGVDTTAGTFYFDEEDEETTFTLADANGKELSFADIKVGDILNVFESFDDNEKSYFEYIVSSDKVEGSVSETSDNKAWINGTEYTIDDGVTVKAGDKGIFYVDICGVILDRDLDVSSRTFGIYYDAILDDDGVDEEAKVIIYTKDGKFETFTFARNVDFNGENKVKATDLDTESEVETLLGANPGVVMYSANSSGAINAIYTADYIDEATEEDYTYYTNYADETWTEVEYDADDSSIGGVTVADNAVIVTFEDEILAKGTGIKDKYAVSSKAVFAHEESYKIAYIATADDEAEFVIVYGAKAKADPASSVMVVSATPSAGKTEDDDPYYIVRGYVNGELKTVNVDADTYIYKADDEDTKVEVKYVEGEGEDAETIYNIDKGAMIQYTEGDMAAAVRIIATPAQVFATITANTDDDDENDIGFGENAADEETGFLKAGKIEKHTSSMIYYADGTKVNFKSATKIVKITLNDDNTAINRVFAGYTLANAENNDKANDANDNDDIVITYSFDKEGLGGIFIDVDGDAKK